MTMFWPSCNCCQQCNIFTWDSANGLADWTVDSGTWSVTSGRIECTAAGELSLDKTVPSEGYFAIVIRASDPDQTIAIKLTDGTNTAVMELTIADHTADDAGTLSLTLNGTEQFTTLPQRSDIADFDDADHYILLHCSWSGGFLRVEAGYTDYASAGEFDCIATRAAIAWTPDAISIDADPLTGTLRILEVSLDRIETDDEVCVVETDCAAHLQTADANIHKKIGSRIGSWDIDWWDVNEYTADATVTGDPDTPNTVSSVLPLAISITEEIRDTGYVVIGVLSASAAMNIGTRYHLASLWIDNDNVELRWYATRTQFSPSLFTWQAEIWIGGVQDSVGSAVNGAGLGSIPTGGAMFIWVGADKLRAGVAASYSDSPAQIETSVSATFLGEFVKATWGADTVAGEIEAVRAFYCDGPPASGY